MDIRALVKTTGIFIAVLIVAAVLATAVDVWGPYGLLLILMPAAFIVVYDGVK